MDGRDPAADDYDPGEADDDDGSFVGGMEQLTRIDAALDNTDDPLQLVSDRGERRGATRQPDQVSSSLLSSVSMPPSEDVMAAWLYPIVSGQEDPADADDVLKVAMTAGSSSKGKLPATDVMFKDPNTSEKKNTSGGSSSRQVSATHNMTEKRRRCKIAERFTTLKQLVPGCDRKSNQATTLDRTVQYMRWLQQQVQSMSTSWQAPPPAAYPVVQTPPVAVPMPPAPTFRPGVVRMVPYGAMLSNPHNHAPMMPVAAPAAPLYMPAQAGASPAAPDATGDHADCSVPTGQQQHQHKEKGGRKS